MKARLIGVAFAALIAAPAAAQVQWSQPRQPSAPSTTYSRDGANRYVTTVNPDGSSTVRGTNYETGSRWKTETAPDGVSRGTDAEGNRWTYNPETTVYRNTGTGVTCRGEGSRRRCY